MGPVKKGKPEKCEACGKECAKMLYGYDVGMTAPYGVFRFVRRDLCGTCAKRTVYHLEKALLVAEAEFERIQNEQKGNNNG